MSRRAKSSRKAATARSTFKKSLPKIRGAGDRTSRINAVLVDLSKKTETELEYWKVFQGYLVDEREKRKERIHAALRSQSVSGYANERLVRIVDTRYQTRPLSSYGSVAVPPGGRFNFGEISSYHRQFQALYLASDFRTAASERFLREQASDDSVDQESLDFRLDPNASFSFYRVRVSNLSVIDIRDTGSLQPFVDVISEIELPKWMIELARQLRQPIPRTVKSVDELRTLLFDPVFTQWGSLIDQPAASQWFGYYVREAGVQGVVYPSVRNESGYNLAIFPDALGETTARVELIDVAAGVRSEDRVLDSGSAHFQMQISSRAGDIIH